MADVISLSNYFHQRPEHVIGEVIFISEDRSLKILHDRGIRQNPAVLLSMMG
jgi:hypothetical protein